MTQIKDEESVATLCVHGCVCVARTSAHHPEKEALGADLLKELITGGKAALIMLPCGLTAWRGGVRRVQSKGK